MEKRNLPQPEPGSHNQQIVYYQEDEIDLYELFLTLKKRWKTVIAVLTVFIIAAVIYVVISRPIYKTDFLVKLPSISSGDRDIILSSPEETKAMVNNLNDLIKEKRYKKVSKLLDIPGKTVLNLNSISASSIKKNNRVVKITLEVYQPAEIPLLTEKLVDYMNNNRFVKERMRLKKEEITYSLKELKEKITEIQNIKDIILKKLEKGQIKNLGFNPLEMDEKIIGLKNRINTLENQLKLLRGYEIAVEPVIPEEPAKPKKALIITVASITGLFLGIFITFFLEWLENVRKKENWKGVS